MTVLSGRVGRMGRMAETHGRNERECINTSAQRQPRRRACTVHISARTMSDRGMSWVRPDGSLIPVPEHEQIQTNTDAAAAQLEKDADLAGAYPKYVEAQKELGKQALRERREAARRKALAQGGAALKRFNEGTRPVGAIGRAHRRLKKRRREKKAQEAAEKAAEKAAKEAEAKSAAAAAAGAEAAGGAAKRFAPVRLRF